MSWAQFIPMAAQGVSSIFDSSASVVDAEAQKRMDLNTANANEERIRRDSSAALGMQRAAAAQSGFVSNTGSMLTLQGESAGNAELDALTERYKGQLSAWQMDQQISRRNEKLAFMIDPIFGGRKSGAGLLFGGGVSYFVGSRVRTGSKVPGFGKV